MEELTAPAPTRAVEPSVPVPARLRVHPGLTHRLRWHYAVLVRALRRTIVSAGAHGCSNLAQSTAYSAFLALLPALAVAAAVIGLLPDTAPIRVQLAAFFDRILPSDVSPLLDGAFQSTPEHGHSVRALVGAGFVSFLGATNIISTLMEGLRRARNLPRNSWSFWRRRRRTVELVFLSLIPLGVASLLIVFGHAVTQWLVSSIGPQSRAPIYTIAVLVRWAVSFAASIGLIGLLYHLGVPDARLPISIPAPIAVPLARTAGRTRRVILRSLPLGGAPSSAGTMSPAGVPVRFWQAIIPGAVMATATWFLTTLAFGWYVTRFTNYSEFYGSIGAAIALLIWLYIVSFSVLCGAEFNAQFDRLASISLRARRTPASVPDRAPSPPA